MKEPSGRYLRMLNWVLDHTRLVLALGAAMAVIGVLCLPLPRIYVELDPLLPEDSEITQTIRQSQRLFGPTDYIVIGLTHQRGQALDAEGARQLARVHAALLTLPRVVPDDVTSFLSGKAKVVDSRDGELHIAPVLRDPSDWKGATERARGSSIYRNLLSADGRSLLLLLRIVEPPEGKLVFMRTLQDALEKVQDPAFTVFVGGQPAVFAQLERFSQNVFLVLPFTVLLIGLIHFEAFRTLQGLVFPLVTAILSAALATAVMNQAGVKLDAFNATAPLIILALTAGHAVQMLKRYNEEFIELAGALKPGTPAWGAANRKAVELAFSRIAPVMAAASVVAAASFASLAVFKTPAVRVYGIYVAVGILVGLVIELIFVPALRSRIVPKSLPAGEIRRNVWDRIVEGCARLCAGPNRSKTLAVSATALAVLAWIGANVKVDNSVEEYFARFTEIRKAERALNEGFAGSNVLYVLLQGSGENAVATAQTANLMRQIQSWMEAKSQIGAAVSYVDVAAEVGCGFDRSYCGPGALPWSDEAIRQFLYLYEAGAGVGVLSEFVTERREAALVRVLSKTDSSLFVHELFRDLKATFQSQLPPGVTLMLGGTGATTLALNNRFIEAKLYNIVQILSIAAVIAGLLFRSALMGVLVAVPLLGATIFAFATMALTGIPLNVATIFIAAIAVGIGSDYAIYFGMRLREFQIRYAGDEDRAARETFRTAGKAALFVSCAVAGGYLGLVASIGYNVHLWLGVVVAAAMLGSILVSLTLFPALLGTLRPAAVFGAAKRH